MGRSESSRSLGFSICLRGRPTIKASSPVQSKSSSAFSVIFLHSTVNSSRAVEICRWITAKLQSAIDTMTQAAERARRARLDLLDRMEHEGWDLERLRSEAQHSRYLALALGLVSGVAQFLYISLTELTEHFGSDSATAFWSLFSIGRGEMGELTYPTEMNLAEQRSLIGLTTIERCAHWRTNSSWPC